MIKYFCSLAVLWHLIFSPIAALAVNPADLVRLKKAGVSDQVISAVIKSNAIDRAIISTDEIVAMKAANMPDGAILKIIEDANQPVPELDRQDAKDFALKRDIKRLKMEMQGKIKRAEMKLELKKKALEVTKKQLRIAREHLSKLITNPEIIKLAKDGKISGKDYAVIVKYLKQYARDEDSVDYREDRHIDIDIKNKVYGTSERTKRPKNYRPHIYIVKEKN